MVRSIFWPLLLIVVGVLLLLGNFNLIAINPWLLIRDYWPLLLIAAGLDILLSGFLRRDRPSRVSDDR
ncbi:MAG: LiaI-LiaF-like domain-containing protein [Anaerolineae bacterium]